VLRLHIPISAVREGGRNKKCQMTLCICYVQYSIPISAVREGGRE